MAARCKTTENDDQVRTSHRRGLMGRLGQWDTNFLVSVISGRGGLFAAGGQRLSCYFPVSSSQRRLRTEVGFCVFPNVTVLENGERDMI